jgi:hypothetical protein
MATYSPASVAQIIAAKRLSKAIRLADMLEAKGFTADLVRGFDDHAWHLAAAAACLAKIPSAETQEFVLSLLDRREQYRPGGPFAGFRQKLR